MKRKWTGVLPVLTALCIGIRFPAQAADFSLPEIRGYTESEQIEITGNTIRYDFPDSSEQDVSELNELLNQMELASLTSDDTKVYLVETKKGGTSSFRFGLSSGELNFEEAEAPEKAHHFQIDLSVSPEEFENVEAKWKEDHPDCVLRELAQFTFQNKEMYGYFILYHPKEDSSMEKVTEAPAESPETESVTEEAADGTKKPVEITKELVRMLQEKLNDEGYDCGEPDGLIGPKTRAAIRKFREDHGLSVSEEIDRELLDTLYYEYSDRA